MSEAGKAAQAVDTARAAPRPPHDFHLYAVELHVRLYFDMATNTRAGAEKWLNGREGGRVVCLRIVECEEPK